MDSLGTCSLDNGSIVVINPCKHRSVFKSQPVHCGAGSRVLLWYLPMSLGGLHLDKRSFLNSAPAMKEMRGHFMSFGSFKSMPVI